jgi:MFS family permease
MLADYYPPRRRAFAMATLALGGSFGTMIGFVGGGFIAEAYGWRIALISVGAPGLLLAFVMGRLLKEPARGAFEAETPPPPPPILTTAGYLWANPAMRHLIAASTAAGLMTYGLTQWLPTFFIRTHELSQSQAGMMIAGVFGVLGAIGALVAGKWFDRLSIRGFQYGLWMIAIVPFISMPLFIMGLFADNLTTAMLLFIIPGFACNCFMGPTSAMLVTLSPVHMRGVSVAINMLCINLIGLGLGPLVVGVLSDSLAPHYGEDALGVALAYFSLVGLWGSVHCWLCARALVKQQKANQL